MKMKIILALVCILLIASLVWAVSSMIKAKAANKESEEARAALGKAQEKIAEEMRFNQMLMKNSAKVVEQMESLKGDLEKARSAGMKTPITGKMETAAMATETTKTIETPQELKEKCPELPDTITVKVPQDLWLEGEIAVLKSVTDKYSWKALFNIWDGKQLLAKGIQPDPEKSFLNIDPELLEPKKIRSLFEIFGGFGIADDFFIEVGATYYPHRGPWGARGSYRKYISTDPEKTQGEILAMGVIRF